MIIRKWSKEQFEEKSKVQAKLNIFNDKIKDLQAEFNSATLSLNQHTNEMRELNKEIKGFAQ